MDRMTPVLACRIKQNLENAFGQSLDWITPADARHDFEYGGIHSSGQSFVDCRVEFVELDPGVCGGELPVGFDGDAVATIFPGCDAFR